MIKYTVRSREIIDLVNDIKRGRLVLSPFFQRNLVWREIHKKDFIETILKGFPFPQIFIARGTIDVDSMTSTSCIVDGQQRMNSIIQFVNNELEVNGKNFSDLSVSEREDFLKYEVAVIDFDLNENDPQLIDIFQRLNRTFYSLSTIEKYSTEYASSEYMLVAKVLCDELPFVRNTDDDIEEASPSLEKNPNITHEFFQWVGRQHLGQYQELMLGGKIFSPYETSRMVHLMYTLNLMATYEFGFYNRNDKAREYLEKYAEVYPLKDDIAEIFGRTAAFVNAMRFPKTSMWMKKANAFTLFIVVTSQLVVYEDTGARKTKTALENFEKQVPDSYALAAREGVNNRAERKLRHDILSEFASAQLGL